jgi:hypothetical protein
MFCGYITNFALVVLIANIYIYLLGRLGNYNQYP